MKQRRGDEAVAELYDRHAPALLLYARQWAGPDAEDVVQRVFVTLIASGRLPAEPRTWLFRCVRNEAMGLGRSGRRRKRREGQVAAVRREWFEARPEDPLSAAEAQAALEGLPAELREVVTLRLWGDLTLSEIAEITGAAVSTVHGRYKTAMETLRKRLEAPCPKKMT